MAQFTATSRGNRVLQKLSRTPTFDCSDRFQRTGDNLGDFLRKCT